MTGGKKSDRPGLTKVPAPTKKRVEEENAEQKREARREAIFSDHRLKARLAGGHFGAGDKGNSANNPCAQFVVAVGALTLLARVAFLVRRPVWFDELFTLWIARQSPERILGTLRLDSGPPLFYFLEWPLARLAEAVSLDALARAWPFIAVAALFLAGARRETSGGPVVPLATSPPLFYSEKWPTRSWPLGFLLFLADFRFRSPRSRPGRRAARDPP